MKSLGVRMMIIALLDEERKENVLCKIKGHVIEIDGVFIGIHRPHPKTVNILDTKSAKMWQLSELTTGCTGDNVKNFKTVTDAKKAITPDLIAKIKDNLKEPRARVFKQHIKEYYIDLDSPLKDILYPEV